MAKRFQHQKAPDQPTREPVVGGYERGVYQPPWTAMGGRVILVAVNSNGERVAEEVVVGYSDEEDGAIARLEQFLDRIDPASVAPPLREIPDAHVTLERNGLSLIVVDRGNRNRPSPPRLRREPQPA